MVGNKNNISITSSDLKMKIKVTFYKIIILQLLYDRFYPIFHQNDASGADNKSVPSTDLKGVSTDLKGVVRFTFHKE